MADDLVPLTTPQLEARLPDWLDHLGKQNGQRLQEVANLFPSGPASLAAALEIIAPGKDRPAALAAYQTFAKRANDAAKDAGLSLSLRVDSKKQSAPADRLTWIEGPSPDIASLAQFTREAVSTVDRADAIVPPMAVILTDAEIRSARPARPLLRFFVSYAHDDRDKVKKLQDPLEKELQISKHYQFEIWNDRKIEVGADWDREIQDALRTCHFGLLFVSRDFLLSRYITEKELPLFLKGEKPVIPVALTPLDFHRVDLKGLETLQLFRLPSEKGEPRAFTECTGLTADKFVRELASKIEEKITSALATELALQSKLIHRTTQAPAQSVSAPNTSFSSRVAAKDNSRGLQSTVPPRQKPQPRSGERIPEHPHDPNNDLDGPFRPSAPNNDDAPSDPVSDLAHDILTNTPIPACAVHPELATGSFTAWEKNASVLTQNRTLAVDYLAKWATDPNGSPFCAVLGEVGIGKTTTLMLLARELDSRRAADPSIPPVIFIDLKDYFFDGEPKLDDILREVISRHWKGTGGRAVTPAMVQRAVQERGALVIFDGLDERIIPLSQARRDAFISELWRILPPLSQRPEPGHRSGRLIISCRSHYFPTVTALSAAFTGRDREGIRPNDYTACVILPFREEQVRDYLTKMLGPDRVDDAISVIRSVHNLADLSTRPMLLSLLAPELAELERLKKEGRTVLGVTLYGLFVDKWLARDAGKHQFLPEHKLLMMEALAAHLAALNEKTLPWDKVSRWLDGFLAAHPDIRDRYRNKDAEVLNADFRTATLCLRPDEEKNGFRFAHTSLYEYFLALYLMRAFEEGRPSAWNVPRPSDETFDFACQLLAAGDKVNRVTALAGWSRLLDDRDATADARRNALYAWVLANDKGWPVPSPTAPQLHHLNLENWTLGSVTAPPLDLRGGNLDGTNLDHAVLHCVLLTGSNAAHASTRLAELYQCVLNDATWEHADLTGGTWRDCAARNLKAASAKCHGCDMIRVDLQNAVLPDDWEDRTMGRLGTLKKSFAVALQRGHQNQVLSATWSPDGTRVVSCGRDQTVKVWDASTGRGLLTMTGHEKRINSVAWSPDGTRVVSGGDDTVKVWDVGTGRCLLAVEGHVSPINSVAWSPDGTRVVSGGDDTVKVWNSGTGRCLLALEGHVSPVNSVAWSPDGTRVVSGGADGRLRVWNAITGRCLLTRKEGGNNEIKSVAWSPDGMRVVSGSKNGVNVWDATTGRNLLSLQDHVGLVKSVAWSPDGKQIVSGGDNELNVWDATTGRGLLTMTGRNGANSVAWSPDGARVVSGCNDEVKVWDAANGRGLLTIRRHVYPIDCVAWSPDGTRMASSSADKTVKAWDAATGLGLLALEGQAHTIDSVAWSPDGKQAVSGGSHEVKVWDAITGQCQRTMKGHNARVNSVAWSPDGGHVVSASSDHTLKVWRAALIRCLHTLKGHEDKVNSVAWSPDGAWVISGSDDKTVKVWDASTGRWTQTLKGHQNKVHSVAWSPGGTRVVSGSSDQTVKVWEVAWCHCLLTLEGHGNSVLSVAWSPDGARLVSGSDDNTLKVWDAATGRCLHTLEGHANGVRSVAWSPDGAQLLSGGGDGTMRTWDASTGLLLRTWVISGDEVALVDFPGNRILHATPDAWRLLGWQGYDPIAKRRRLLPAEAFGPLPPWPS